MHDSDASTGSEDVIQPFEVALIHAVIKDAAMLEAAIEDAAKSTTKDAAANLRSEERLDVASVSVAGPDVAGTHEREEAAPAPHPESGVSVVEHTHKVQLHDRNKGKAPADSDLDTDTDTDDDDTDDERPEVQRFEDAKQAYFAQEAAKRAAI